jgi:hypothetical protein
VDEKSQVQALDRTSRSCPCYRHPERRIHHHLEQAIQAWIDTWNENPGRLSGPRPGLVAYVFTVAAAPGFFEGARRVDWDWLNMV